MLSFAAVEPPIARADTSPDCFAIHLLDITVPPTPWSPWDVLSIAYSLIPWIAAVSLLIAALTTRKRTFATCAVLLLLMISVNELVIKRLIRQPRPERSCLSSQGMPSSHSLISAGFIVFVAMECLVGDIDISALRRKTTTTRWKIVAALACGFAPVPLARVHLGDHSVAQVIVGMAVGTLFGVAFFFSNRSYHRRRKKKRQHHCPH